MINGIVQSFGNVVAHFQVQTSELLARCQCQSMFMIKGGCGIYKIIGPATAGLPNLLHPWLLIL